MSKAKGNGKSARQKLRRRAKRAEHALSTKKTNAAQSIQAAMKFECPKVDWTEAGKELEKLALANDSNLLQEAREQFIKDETKRMERMVVSAKAWGMTEVHIPDALIKERATVVDLTTASHNYNHGEGEGDTCTYCGDKDYMADKYCSMGKLVQQYQLVGEIIKRDELLPPVGTVEDSLIFGNGALDAARNCTDHICSNDCETCGCSDKMGVATDDEVEHGITIGGTTTDGNGVCE